MSPKEYIEALENLAFKFRDDDDLCDRNCSFCQLSKQLKALDGVTYCDVLVAIHNDAVENE